MSTKYAAKIRDIKAIWVITTKMELVTATHLGGESEGSIDMPVIKDDKESPFLPGETLAGLLRSHLADVLGGYRTEEDCKVAKLFGSKKDNKYGSQSPLIVHESYAILPEEQSIEIRDGVKIEHSSGIAENHGKYDFEVLPKGTSFDLRFNLIIEEEHDEKALLELLNTSLSGLSEHEITLGMKGTRGLGHVKTREWKTYRFDMTNNGWEEWANSDHEKPLERPELINENLMIDSKESFKSSVQQTINGITELSSINFETTTDKRLRMIAEIELKLDGDILIKSPGKDVDSPDAVHLHSAGKPILPGTSVAGVLRNHAFRISHLFKGDNAAKKIVNDLFGHEKDFIDKNDQIIPKSSKLRISENFIYGSSSNDQTRNRIDNFEGGAADTALFDERVEKGGRVHNLRIEIRNPKEQEARLLVLLINDLISGKIAFGGTSSVGRGFFTGDARIELDSPQIDLTKENFNEIDEMLSSYTKWEGDNE